jgi:hypothetical protein
VIAFKTRRGITPARCFGDRGPVFGMIGRELGGLRRITLFFTGDITMLLAATLSLSTNCCQRLQASILN